MYQADTTTSIFHDERNIDSPVDILVFGTENRRRIWLYSKFVKLAQENQLSVRFLLETDDFNEDDEASLVNGAKVSQSRFLPVAYLHHD